MGGEQSSIPTEVVAVENTSTTGFGTTDQAGSGQATMDQSTNQMQDMTQQAKETASNLVDQARTQVKTQLTNQKEKAAESLGGVAEAIRQTGSTLENQEQPMPMGRYVNQAADVVDNVAQYLRTKDLDEMFHQAEDLARRRPAVFIGAAFALGFMAARFLKSSGSAASSSGFTGNGSRQYGTGAYANNQFDAPYYQERETILEAQVHEQQGYPHKSPYETAREMGIETPRTGQAAGAGSYSGYAASGGSTGMTSGLGSSTSAGMDTDLNSDLDDDDLMADYTPSTSTRSSDV
jgi:hypothetical protein